MIEKAKGAQIRSKATWWEEGEKSSSYFLRLEKRRQSNNTIKQLKSESGELLDTDAEVIRCASQFYESLYKSNAHDTIGIRKYVAETDTPNILSVHEKFECEGKVTMNECNKVIEKLKLNKS